MGACLSCLGFGPRESEAENPETSRLLYDEPYRSQYGSNIQNTQRLAYQPDPESLRREREALEGICHSMSDEVVDVFTVLSPTSNEAHPNRSKPPLKPHASAPKDPAMASEELRYRTVKRGRVGRVASPLKKDERGWRATKAVMG